MMGRMATCMKLDEKLQKISDKTQRRMDRVGIILGLSLLLASFVSFFVLEAYAQELFSLNCPENAYHGLDNQGNAACRDILSNQVVEPVSVIDSDKEMTNSGIGIFADSAIGEIILNDDQTDYNIINILGLIGITAAAVVFRKKIVSIFSQIRGWNSIQKEQVRTSQYGRCNICYRNTSKWTYDHIDGNKRNNDISNCQGLCPQCKSERNMIRI
jgi:hypothetical protein